MHIITNNSAAVSHDENIHKNMGTIINVFLYIRNGGLLCINMMKRTITAMIV